jgi:integrase
VKPRVQHPKVQECKTKNPYWFFRYWDDEIVDGEVVTTRKRHICGPSKGETAITKKEATAIRDAFLAKLNAPTEKVAISKGQALFGEVAKMYLESHVNRRGKMAAPSREKEVWMVETFLLPTWGKRRLADIRPKEIEDWLFSLKRKDGGPLSWCAMKDLRRCMSAIYHKAEDWQLWEEGKRPPTIKVDIGKRSYRFEKKILDWDQTAAVLARLADPNKLVIETCVATSTRISEVTGLMIKHFDPATRTIRIEQRNWRMDIDDPKTDGSKRVLALGDLWERYSDWIAKLERRGPNDWIFPQAGDPAKPLWDSGVRKAIHEAAKEVGCDFPGLGPHSFRRANISWRQEVGGSAIEASKIAGHSEVDMTAEYTFVGIPRQEALTKAIQARLAQVGPKDDGPSPGDLHLQATGAAQGGQLQSDRD